MKKIAAILISIILLTTGVSFSLTVDVGDGFMGGGGPSAMEYVPEFEDSIFEKAADWIATIGKSWEDKRYIIRERKRERNLDKARRMYRKRKKAMDKQMSERKKAMDKEIEG